MNATIGIPPRLYNKKHLVLWSDASCGQPVSSEAAAAVVYKNPRRPGEWRERVFSVPGQRSPDGCELYGISCAMVIAYAEIQHQGCDKTCVAPHGEGTAQRYNNVTIFTDSQSVVQWMSQRSEVAKGLRTPFEADIFDCSHKLVKLNVRVSIRLAPGHAGIEGNELADRAASRFRKILVARNAIARAKESTKKAGGDTETKKIEGTRCGEGKILDEKEKAFVDKAVEAKSSFEKRMRSLTMICGLTETERFQLEAARAGQKRKLVVEPDHESNEGNKFKATAATEVLQTSSSIRGDHERSRHAKRSKVERR